MCTSELVRTRENDGVRLLEVTSGAFRKQQLVGRKLLVRLRNGRGFGTETESTDWSWKYYEKCVQRHLRSSVAFLSSFYSDACDCHVAPDVLSGSWRRR